MAMTSLIGLTSSLLARRGRRDLPSADAPAMMCVKLNCFCAAMISGVSASGRNPVNASLSATRTRLTPSSLATDDATSLQLEPATRTVTSLPICFAAVMELCVIGVRVALLCSAMTKVL